MFVVVIRRGREEKLFGRYATSREAAAVARQIRSDLRRAKERGMTASVRRVRAKRNPVQRPEWLSVVQGEGPRPGRKAASGPRMEALEGGVSDLSFMGSLMDPSSRIVRTVSRGGIPLRSITLESSESPLVPENLPLASIEQAEQLLNWMNDHTEREGGYDKTVIRVEWADGSVWRGRFDVDGKWRTRDLFGKEHGGGITWENTTDKAKAYDRSRVLFDQPFRDLILKIQKERRKKSMAQMDEAQRVKIEIEQKWKKLGLKPEVVYLQPAHTDPSDAFHPERYFRLHFERPYYVFEWATSLSPEDVQRSNIYSDAYWLEDRERFMGATPTQYRDLSEIPKRVAVRDLARQISGEQYPGASVENKIIKAALQLYLPKTAKVSVRASTGTGYGYSYASIEGATPEQEKRAFAVIGERHSPFERYYASISASDVPKILQKLKKA